MYAEHVPAINAAMRASFPTFLRGCMFAICSIRQPVTAVPDQLGELDDYRESAPCLFGHKVGAYLYLSDATTGPALWRDVCALPLTRAGAEAGLMRLLDVPGLGIVKGAFILQFLGHNVGCLDTRNIKREKRNPRAFRTDGKPPAALRPKVKKYLVSTYGKASKYWDHWCEDVATVYDMTPEAVSALHMSIVPDSFVPF